MREGFESIEHVKRYTTTGMATDQGKTSNMNALAFVAGELGRPIPQVGLTTFRMPYTPVTFGTFAGYERARPVRSGAHDADARLGAWRRAPCSRTSASGSAPATSRAPARTCTPRSTRECLAVRAGVGIFDASTLGKIEVVGPDAAEFLIRMYTNGFATLARRAVAATASCCATTASSSTTA